MTTVDAPAGRNVGRNIAEARTFTERISVREDPALTAMFPQYAPNRITVRLTTGKVLTEEVRDVPGGTRVPATDTHLEDKFHGLLRRSPPTPSGLRFFSHAWGIEKCPTSHRSSRP